jgi:hypothetical protein
MSLGIEVVGVGDLMVGGNATRRCWRAVGGPEGQH